MNKILINISNRIGQIYGSNRRLFIFYLLLLALVLWRGMNFGFMGDESGYVTLNTEELARHPWLPFIMRGVDTGHPMLYAWPVAVVWRIFGQVNSAANVSMWIWAAVALAAMHRLMQLILARASSLPTKADRMPALPGALAALGLFCTPLFISLATQYLDPMPYLALLLCILLAWATGRRKTIAVLAAAVVLVRITACFSVLGLGLFDVGYTWFALRRRSWRAVALTLAPYAFSAAVFFTFLFVKRVVLGLPMSTLAWNQFQAGTSEQMGTNIHWILDGMLAMPRYSFKPLLAVAAAGLVVSWWKTRRPKNGLGVPASAGIPPEGGTPERTSPWWIYGACIASMAVPTLFYVIYPYYPHARYLLAWHAFIVLAGVHGFYVLSGRRAWLALLLLAPWCGLQVTRWHSHWAERAFASLPYHLRTSLRIHPGVCLDVLARKEMTHKAARWLKRNRPASHQILMCLYPTSTMFGTRAAGFVNKPYNIFPMGRVASSGDPDKTFRELLESSAPFFVIQAVWDSQVERRVIESLMRKVPFRPVLKIENPSGEWIRIFCCDRPASAKTDPR